MKDLLKGVDALPAVRLAYIDDRSFPQTAKALAHKRTLLGVQRLRRRRRRAA